MMANIAPVHLMKWIEEHQTLFSGPVANKEVFPESEFIYQIVRGPNARNDFHIDPGDEIFYQLKGDITVRCIDADGSLRDITVREGEAMLCRAGTPHCPIRPADTWGLVIERKRRPAPLEPGSPATSRGAPAVPGRLRARGVWGPVPHPKYRCISRRSDRSCTHRRRTVGAEP